MYLLVICEILAQFAYMLTADHKYFLCNRENIQQPIQMQLSKKEKNFLSIFCSISEVKIEFLTC